MTPPVVHMFWHGSPLSRVEWLSLSSFIHHGHSVHLHVYEDIGPTPNGVTLIDANETLEHRFLFTHRRTGSVALFADWFRYRLLHDRGGIWADTDVVCLRPFSFSVAVIFAWERESYLANGVLGLPKGHPLAKWLADCCEEPNNILPYDPFGARIRKWRRRYLQGNDRSNIRWAEYGPKGLTHAARYFDLLKMALPVDAFYPIPCEQWSSIFSGDGSRHAESLKNSYGLHLWNTMLRGDSAFDKNGRHAPLSLFERLWNRYVDGSRQPTPTFDILPTAAA